MSTTGQDTATQEAKLKAAGCTLIRTETVSGGSRDGRDELASILDFIRPGDVLIVVKLDRLGRNTRDVLNLVHELEEKGASLRVLEPAIDTGGPMGRMVLTMLGMVAEMELGFIRDRQRAGIEAAKAKGVYKGRPATFERARIVSLRKEGMGVTEIAKAVLLRRVVSRFWSQCRKDASDFASLRLWRAPALFRTPLVLSPSLRLPICDPWRHPAAAR